MLKLISLALAVGLSACASNAHSADDVPKETASGAMTTSHHDGGHKHAEHSRQHHRFDDPERYAKSWNDPSRDDWQKPDEVIGLMAVAPGMTVADVGTGTGYFVGPLAAAVGADGRVLALDVEQSMVDYVAARAAEQGLTNVEAKKIGFDGPGVEGVDRFLIVNVWHHVAEREAYAAALAAALNSGGKVVVVDFTPDGDEGWGPPKQMRLEAETIAAELEAGGLEAEVVEETLPRQYIVVASKP